MDNILLTFQGKMSQLSLYMAPLCFAFLVGGTTIKCAQAKEPEAMFQTILKCIVLILLLVSHQVIFDEIREITESIASFLNPDGLKNFIDKVEGQAGDLIDQKKKDSGLFKWFTRDYWFNFLVRVLYRITLTFQDLILKVRDFLLSFFKVMIPLTLSMSLFPGFASKAVSVFAKYLALTAWPIGFAFFNLLGESVFIYFFKENETLSHLCPMLGLVFAFLIITFGSIRTPQLMSAMIAGIGSIGGVFTKTMRDAGVGTVATAVGAKNFTLGNQAKGMPNAIQRGAGYVNKAKGIYSGAKNIAQKFNSKPKLDP